MRTSLKTPALVAISVALFGINQTANAAVNFDINVSRGPVSNYSIGNYANNALNVTFGGSPLNDPARPDHFALLGDTVDATDFITSTTSGYDASGGGFTSWLGQANPTGNFSQEVGNRLYFASTWITSATPISLDHLTFSITSAPNPILNRTLVYPTDGYSGSLVAGWNLGPDGIDYSGDEIAGVLSSDPVHNIVVSLGIGNGISALGALGSTNQEELDNTRDFILANIETITFTVSYDWGGGNIESSSKVLTMNGYSVPEPTTLVLLGVGTIIVAIRRRHIQK